MLELVFPDENVIVLHLFNTLQEQFFNPLSPNSDQHQFSPNNIHTLSRDEVMRIKKVVT